MRLATKDEYLTQAKSKSEAERRITTQRETVLMYVRNFAHNPNLLVEYVSNLVYASPQHVNDILRKQGHIK